MATLAAIEKQIAELKKKADGLRQAETKSAIAQARELIQRFGLTADDLGLSGKAGKRAVKLGAKAKTTGLPKYRDPATGKTWTGHGKPPTWIAGAADRTPFLIEPAAAAVVAKPAKASKTPKVSKAPAAPAAPKSKPAAKSTKAVAAKKSPARKARSEAAAETPPPAQA